MGWSRLLRVTPVIGCVLTTSLVGIAWGSPAQAATTPKLCTVKGKTLDVAATIDSLTSGTLYFKNCTGRTIKNVGVLEQDTYPKGASCPSSFGGTILSGTADPHEFNKFTFATGFTQSCHGVYRHTFTAYVGNRVVDSATVRFTVK